MLRSIAQRQRRDLVFADPRPALAGLWRLFHELLSVRLGPLAGLLLVLLTVLWAVGEHAQRRAVLRDVETQRYIAQFAEGPVARARERLRGARHEARPDGTMRMAPAAPAPNDAILRGLRPAADVETVLRFYRRLALCIRMGSCDPAAAAAWFGELSWHFRDRYHRYLVEAHPGEDLDAVFSTIAPRAGTASRPGGRLD